LKRKLLAAALLFVCLHRNMSGQSINGAGATFPYPIYSKWFSEYNRLHPEVKINYQSIGSGGGIRQVSDGIIDFGATDSPMSDQLIASSRVKTAHIPTVLGAIVPIYNVPGVHKNLNFSGDVIADIYLKRITRWNDPRIVHDNPGVALPDQPILAVYRSDGSGTTFILTDYLAKVSSDWQTMVGRNTAVRWRTGVGQKGNEGVAGMVRQSPYSFGYVELIYAVRNNMSFGAVKNQAGKFVTASINSTTAAAAASMKGMPSDFRISITNAPGEGSYPIVSFTWLLVPLQARDSAKASAMKDFLNWMLEHGESEAAAQSYAPLPREMMDPIRRITAQLR
jgi:phosphate transport system substrate-binding protein